MIETQICNTCLKSKGISLFAKHGTGYHRICNECKASYQRERRKKRREQAQAWYIYTLVDPRDNAIRYVGQTYTPRTRVMGHMADARNGTVNPAKNAWLNELAQNNLLPRMDIIEETTEDLVSAREVYWIAEMIRRGNNLLNAPLYNTHGRDYGRNDPTAE